MEVTLCTKKRDFLKKISRFIKEKPSYNSWASAEVIGTSNLLSFELKLKFQCRFLFYEKASTENIITVMKIHCSSSGMYGNYFVQFAEECHNKMMGVTPEKTTPKDNS